MKVDISIVGYPRVGNKRQFKWAVEKYWRSEINLEELVSKSDELICNNWDIQTKNGIKSSYWRFFILRSGFRYSYSQVYLKDLNTQTIRI